MSAELIQQYQPQIEISDDDIANAEKVLLGDTGRFSDESKVFIKNLTTIDLCAVPGSGKTTALHAKLLCLEKHLPFDDGSGICILSHTNTAVDEIKEKIALYCPYLFKYPNFIGTIQDFVDTFFVKPYFNNHIEYGKIKVIDDDVFKDQLLREYDKIKRERDKNNKTYGGVLYNGYQEAQKRGYQENEETYIKDALFLAYPDYNKNKVSFLESIIGISHKTLFNEEKFEGGKVIRNNVFASGCISYKLAYIFANEILDDIYTGLIRKRFPFVFVDEAQDMNKLQGDLLEKLFGPDNNTITQCYQRIGDPNQSIYSGGDEEGYEWNIRLPLQLINSRRFSHKIAKIVEQFGVLSKSEDYNIETNIIGGCSCDDYDSCSCIKPYLIIYDNPLEVLDKYIEIIKYHQENSGLSANKYKYTAIGRRGSEASRFIGSYYPPYIKDKIKPKKIYNSCQECLFYIDRSIVGFAEIQKAILRSISKAVTLAGGEFKTTRELITSIKKLDETNENYYEDYKEKMRSWCKTIHIGTVDSNLVQEIKGFVEDYLMKFDIMPTASNQYNAFWNLTTTISTPVTDPGTKDKNNIYSNDGIDVHIQTIHSVKGQTHEATLYMETYSNKGYDTIRMKKFQSGDKSNVVLQTAKMLYVGLSRPRKLLCFAIHKENYDLIKNYFDSHTRVIH